MSKWRKVGSAYACAPSMVRAKQRTRTTSRRFIAFPRMSFHAVCRLSTCKGLRWIDGWRGINRHCVGSVATGRRAGSAPWVDDHLTGVRMADGHRQRRLQRVKELLQISGAEAAADPQSGD